jgi:hypothetical protein
MPPSAPPPQKDLSDPTFYEGWDDHDFEWGGALWPKANESIDERFSLGQYIWHPPEQLTHAVASHIDVPLQVATKDGETVQLDFTVSKYWKSESNCEGDEYVYNFQRIKHVDEWEDRRDDILFKHYPPTTDPEPIPVTEILSAVLDRDKREKETRTQDDVMGSLEQALTSYIGKAGPSSQTGGSSEEPRIVPKSDAQEALLASLGVMGSAKPVYSTPFPAYAPVIDPIFRDPVTPQPSVPQA